MRVLAVDTSTARLTVALLEAGELVREAQAGELAGSQLHGEALAGLVQQVLDGTTPDLVAVGLGPGPYTGLRVGIVTAEALAFAWQVPVKGVPTLAALAHGYRSRGGGACVAVLDVKRREVAWQAFDADGGELSAPAITHIERLADLPQLPLVGPAFVSQRLVSPEVADAAPVSAVSIAHLALQSPAGDLAPLYLRVPDAAEPAPRKRVGDV